MRSAVTSPAMRPGPVEIRRRPGREVSPALRSRSAWPRGCVAMGLCLTAIASLASPLRASVVLTEIHYHPPGADGEGLEFVEIANLGSATIDLGGWRFREGVEFEFPPDTRLAPGARRVVARDRARLLAVYSLDPASVLGDFAGALDNSGERITLVDDLDTWVDGVEYDDQEPWPEAADGDGASLERLCESDPAASPLNWISSLDGVPTPGAPAMRSDCPAPTYRRPRVAITEIHFHPPHDDAEGEEFIELLNPGDETLSLVGWRLRGIGFTFGPGARIDPGQRVVVARDPARMLETFGVETPHGPYRGALSNDGERVDLLDASGELVDSVRYGQALDWPVEADGLGHSLERISIDVDPDDPGNWSPSVASSDRFRRVVVEGTLPSLTTQRLLLGIDGEGELIVDDLSLVSVDDPDVELLVGGDLESALDRWTPGSSVEASRFEAGVGVGESTGLRLVSNGPCGGDSCDACTIGRSFVRSLDTIATSSTHRLSISYRAIRGSARLYFRVHRGPGICLGDRFATPGAPNASEGELPAFLGARGRFPPAPGSLDPVTLSVRARAPAAGDLESVDLEIRVDGEWRAMPMHDDGVGADRVARDGVWTIELAPEESGSIRLYRFVARSRDGLPLAASPRSLDLARRGPDEVWGYHVDDAPRDSSLPRYEIVLDGVDASDPLALNSALDCTSLVPATFIHRGEVYPEVGLRFRGNTACSLAKRSLKLRFRRGRELGSWRKINLQSLWTDKSLVREHLAWQLVEELGLPSFETEYVEVRLNGLYHGLFLYLEHPDEQFLTRNGLSPHDCIYKAEPATPLDGAAGPLVGVARRASVAEYAEFWERETCESLDHASLAAFIDELHSGDIDRPGGSFFDERVDPRSLIAYQIAQVALNNLDGFGKNHFLHWDRDRDRWSLLPWDLDLVLGKSFDARLNQPFPPRVGTINDCLLSPGGDLGPWYGTTIAGSVRRNWLLDLFLRADGGRFQRAYLSELRTVAEEKLSDRSLRARLLEIRDRIAGDEARDRARWGRTEVTCFADCANCNEALDLATNLEVVLAQAALHREFLLAELAGIERRSPGTVSAPRLKLTEILYAPADEGEALEFLELFNPGEDAVDLSGWRFERGLDGFVFPLGAFVGPGELLVVARDPLALVTAHPGLEGRARLFGGYSGRLRNEGETLRLVRADPGFPGLVDQVSFGDGSDGRWPRTRGGHSIELVDLQAETDNDHAGFWRRSSRPGGTPGLAPAPPSPPPPTFVRGDVSGDGRLRISDAVELLLFLFAGTEPIACLDAGDVDDDGSLTISDATRLLVYLFRGGPRPPSPYPLAGEDPSPDALDCASASPRA